MWVYVCADNVLGDSSERAIVTPLTSSWSVALRSDDVVAFGRVIVISIVLHIIYGLVHKMLDKPKNEKSTAFPTPTAEKRQHSQVRKSICSQVSGWRHGL